MTRSVSIRRSMLVNLVAMLVLLSVALQGTMAIGARRSVRTLSEAPITRTIDQTEARLGPLFGPATEDLGVARFWGEQGLLDIDEPDRIRELLEAGSRRSRRRWWPLNGGGRSRCCKSATSGLPGGRGTTSGAIARSERTDCFHLVSSRRLHDAPAKHR